jgi:hypothetical protein
MPTHRRDTLPLEADMFVHLPLSITVEQREVLLLRSGTYRERTHVPVSAAVVAAKLRVAYLQQVKSSMHQCFTASGQRNTHAVALKDEGHTYAYMTCMRVTG